MEAAAQKKDDQTRQRLEKQLDEFCFTQNAEVQDLADIVGSDFGPSQETLDLLTLLLRSPDKCAGLTFHHRFAGEGNFIIYHGTILKKKKTLGKVMSFDVAYYNVSDSPDTNWDEVVKRSTIFVDALLGDLSISDVFP
jgi:hypothetical protein